MSNLKLEKRGKINYPNFINECAVYIGKLRDLYNYNLNEDNDSFKRGDRSEYVNILGVKGEMIFSYYLQSINIPHTTNKLLSNTPISDYDIIVGKKKIDIKTIRTDAPDLLVNKDAHNKNKNIDTYVFIQPISKNTVKYWIFKYDEVNTWEIKNVKYSDAYYKEIGTILI